ncbi:protein-disulfide reductase DsbD family protein [Anatilimnocola floriformis]|uniref:protein-disulfide reductase DsbD family protein n=1 Tax=Anatilimnocola floriformis TaxID=2948575 RepID=UPI0020C441D0|nr:thioredoxin family protein [Anatilimnocola floriformis]
MRSTISLVLLVACAVTVAAQEGSKFGGKKFNFDFGAGAAPAGELDIAAKFYVTKDSAKGRLVVEATISPEWHTFSTTQPSGGPQASTIKVADSVDVRLTGPFTPDRDPHKEPSTAFTDDAGKPLTEETFEDKVVWTAPIELTAGVKPESLEIALTYNGQICHGTGGCIPKTIKATAKFVSYDEPPQTAGVFHQQGSNVTISGRLEPGVVTPGSKAKLIITAKAEPKWHVYELQNQVGKSTNQPTLIVVSRKGDLAVGEPQPSSKAVPPHGAESDLPYHEGEVSWTSEIEVPASAKSGEVELGGFLGFQTCSGTNCQPPQGATFQVNLKIAEKAESAPALLSFVSTSYKNVSEQAQLFNAGQNRSSVAANTAPLPLPLLILVALAGGFFLNFMPCVLPVLGLKLLSFAKQGGESKGRMIAINLAYTAGLMVIFMLLAVLSITLGLAWGQHLSYLWFRITILTVTFAMGLSLFSVWEIPVPGFAEGSHNLQQKEGLAGAFYKGLFTTILGISCSGPLLGVALNATIGLPPIYTLLVFFFVGLGMASPFLALPFVPGINKLLPKPGDWMETFKQVMGFVIMGAAVFFFSAIEDEWKIAVLTLLLGVSLACWWVGKVPLYEPVGKQLNAWITGGAAAGIIGVVAFNFFGPPPPEARIEWQNFSIANITQQEQANRTVLVDFTADWCANCKVNLKWAIERADVKQLIDENNVVAMKADWTSANPDLEEELKRLGRKQIPVLAIYPAGKPDEVLVLDGLVWKQQVISTIRRAGPSQTPLEKKSQPAKSLTAKN